jgi:hypothetical protein
MCRAVVLAERARRRELDDPDRWHIYLENLYHLIVQLPPERARESQRLWRLHGNSKGMMLPRARKVIQSLAAHIPSFGATRGKL